MSKEKEKAGDTPEELNMLFRKNRIYMLDFEYLTRKIKKRKSSGEAAAKKLKRGLRDKGLP